VRIPNYKKILADLEAVRATDFWDEYISRVIELRRVASRQCEVMDETKKFQGEVKAYDSILALPEKIAKDLEGKIAITSARAGAA